MPSATMELRGENKWRFTVYVGRNHDGSHIRRRKTFHGNEKQAEKALKRFEVEVDQGKAYGSTKYTLRSFAELWLEDYAAQHLAPKTLYRYKEMLEGRILPALGHMRIERIKPVHLLDFYSGLLQDGTRHDGSYKAKPALQERLAKFGTREQQAQAVGVSINTLRSILTGKPTKKAPDVSEALGVAVSEVFEISGGRVAGALSEQTIAHHHRLLSNIFSHAVQWQIIADNPASRVKPPKVKKRRAMCYDDEQAEALLSALDKEPEDVYKFKVIVALAIASGLRRGEIMGLEWRDVNLQECVITVQRASQYVPGIGIITKEPKNESSERLVTIPVGVAALLQNYKAHWNAQRLIAGEKWQGTLRLFATWDGLPMHPDSISNWFPSFLKRHGLPHMSFHGLRHTNATLLIAQGVQPKTISSRLGHSNISTTMDIYGHHMRRADREAAESLGGMFSGLDMAKKSKGS